MVKVINPFNKKLDEVYTAANGNCGCTGAYGDIDANYSQTKATGDYSGVRQCSCGYGTANYNANHK